jgi:hypothetical protein
MSARTLCPNLDVPCEVCVEQFVDEHPGAEVVLRSYHAACDCPMVADFPDADSVCVGCGRTRDTSAEFWRMVGRAS